MKTALESGGLPRTIWILWLQGFAAAPPLVQKCLESWKRHHPAWNVVELDYASLGTSLNLPAIIDVGRPDLTPQALSDIVRINLLAKHGGVWVDATCFCCRPLDTWIDDCMGAGFFAFEKPGPDRLLSSWFLASEPGCHLTLKYRDAVNAYWADHRFAAPPSKPAARAPRAPGDIVEQTGVRAKAARHLRRLLSRNVFLTRLWFSPLVSKGLGLCPYFWFHYLLAEVTRKDRLSRSIWDGRHRYSAHIPHRLQVAGLFEPVSDTLKSVIDRQEDPLYKLAWDGTHPGDCRGCTLEYLLESADRLTALNRLRRELGESSEG